MIQEADAARVNVRMSRETLKHLAALAKNDRRSMNQEISFLIEQEINRRLLAGPTNPLD